MMALADWLAIVARRPPRTIAPNHKNAVSLANAIGYQSARSMAADFARLADIELPSSEFRVVDDADQVLASRRSAPGIAPAVANPTVADPAGAADKQDTTAPIVEQAEDYNEMSADATTAPLDWAPDLAAEREAAALASNASLHATATSIDEPLASGRTGRRALLFAAAAIAAIAAAGLLISLGSDKPESDELGSAPTSAPTSVSTTAAPKVGTSPASPSSKNNAAATSSASNATPTGPTTSTPLATNAKRPFRGGPTRTSPPATKPSTSKKSPEDDLFGSQR